MEGFDPKFEDPPAFILGITHEIWEGRGVETLHDYYSPQIPVRSPDGVVIGNEAVIDATWATLAEFPDRQLLGEDVIWSDDGQGGFLSSHRILSTATHGSDGIYGAATGTKLAYRVIADCAARQNVIYDEWLIRDQGAIVRQLGIDPKAFAAAQIDAEGGPEQARHPFSPEHDVVGPYRGTGNDHAVGRRYEEGLALVAGGDAAAVERTYDRAAHLEIPGGGSAHGWAGAASFWSGLAASFPEATFTAHHRIGRDDPGLGERAAIRWSLDGVHAGRGRFGEPSGASVHVMGISHAEFGPAGLRREWVLFDDTAVWKQILLATG
ncbi:MAG: nuclear transport factor 2 family protein [Actinomycetota bacterium]